MDGITAFMVGVAVGLPIIAVAMDLALRKTFPGRGLRAHLFRMCYGLGLMNYYGPLSREE